MLQAIDVQQTHTPVSRAPTRVYDSLLDTVGGTPLVTLNRLLPDAPFRIVSKLEGFNPGGSIKDRVAMRMLKTALASGDLRPGDTVIESSSGNLGIGLAQACAYLGLRFICVVDPRATLQNLAIIRAYGAEVDLVEEPDPVTGDFLQARINRVMQLVASTPRAFWCNQYANLNNPRAHHQTMHEIIAALGYRLDYLLCATSTCGTLRGCVEYIREHNLPTRVIGVDAVGSVIFGGPSGKRLIPGHGAGRRPDLYQDGLVDDCIHVSDLDCVLGCRRLVASEAILAGGSSGGIVAALLKIQGRIAPGSTCALILPDRGERYLDTIYSDAWVYEHFGTLPQIHQSGTWGWLERTTA
jgi:cysteine synthase A